MTTTEPTVEPTVEPTTVVEEVTEQNVPELSEDQKPAKTTEEEGAVNATEPTPKTQANKRRILFNPFGKTTKKEDEVEPTETEAPTKKVITKGFGNFFSRKATPKPEEEETETTVPTELPQIEQLQPIEADIQIDSDTTAVKEPAQEVAESAENQVTEADTDVEQTTDTQASPAVKRQSFISKLFGKKKQEETTTEVATAVTEEATTTPTTEEEVTTSTEEVAPTARPSSPLGRLTELFISKKAPKKAKTTTEEEESTPAPVEEAQAAVEDAVQETSIAEPTPATVDTSA